MSLPPSDSATKPGFGARVKQRLLKIKDKIVNPAIRGPSLSSTAANSRSSTPLHGPADEGRLLHQSLQLPRTSIPTPSNRPSSTTPTAHGALNVQSTVPDIQLPTNVAPINDHAPAPFPSRKAVATPGPPDPSQSGSDNELQVLTSPASKDRFGTVLNVVSQALKVATAATAVVPPAQSVIGGVSGAVDMVKTMKQNGVDREAVVRTLKEALRRIEMCKSIESPSEEMLKMLSTLEHDIEENLGSIEDAMKESWWKKLVEGDAQEMIKCYTRLSSSLNLFITQTVVSVGGHVEALKKITIELKSTTERNYEAISQFITKAELKDLNCVPEAGYDAGPADLRRACTTGTRKQILDDLMVWATDDEKTQVYWLSGMAGTGKTTIAYSFCQLLQDADLLCTSYFCSRNVASSMDTRSVLPMLAYHLASYSPSFSESLLSALRQPSHSNVRQKELEKQFQALILGPTGLSRIPDMQKRRVLIYDGADEASNLHEVAKLISLFLKHASRLPFKVFISSRRDAIIKYEFGLKEFTPNSTSLLLHDVEKTLVEADIRSYIVEHLQVVRPPVPDATISNLVDISGALFVYAAVLCSFLKQGSDEEFSDRLEAISANTSPPGIPTRPHDNLDQIYMQILKTAQNASRDVWHVLLVILTTYSPLTATSIAKVLAIMDYQVTRVLNSLHSVLTGSESKDYPVTIFHTSFRDFLLDTSRGRDFSRHILANHGHLAHQCLTIMKESLISNDFSEVSRKDNNGKAVEIQGPSPRLAYACANWFIHLLELDVEQLAGCQLGVEAFFSKLVLRWVECMSRLGYLEDAVRSLRKFELSDIMISANLHLAAMDARRMVLQCFDLIQDQPTEIYNSALAWLPKESKMRGRFKSQIVWQITCGLQSDWGACESVMRGHPDTVWSVSFSPDGRRVASGSSDNTVRIWNI
ncbi:hypothetical protein CVT26_006382, partial [Gymnopilus dilepis]